MDIKEILPLVDTTFEFLFPDLNYEIVLGEKIIIKIKNSNPQPVYNPMDFDARFRIFQKDDKTVLMYSRYDFFYPLYAYLADYVKLIIIELYPYPLSIEPIDYNSPCRIFDLIEDFIDQERKIMAPNPLHNYIY